MSFIKTGFIYVLSLGWLLPLWFFGIGVLEFMESIEASESMGSFPRTAFNRDLFYVTFMWMALALSYWVILGVRRKNTKN